MHGKDEMAKTSRPKNKDKQDAVESDEAKEIAQPSEESGEPIVLEELPKGPEEPEAVEAVIITEDSTPEPPVMLTEADHSDEPAKEDQQGNTINTREPNPVATSGGAGSSFVGMVLGGLAAAAIGYGIATYFPLKPGSDTAEALSELKGTVASQAETINNLKVSAGRIDALEQRLVAAESAEPVAPLPVDLGPIEAALASLEERLVAIESLPAGDEGTSSRAVAAALESMKAEIEALKGQGDSAAASIAAAAAEAEARLAEAEAQAAALKEEAEATAKNALQTAALGKIAASLESGMPYEAALAELEGVSIPESLASMAATGVPTVQTLSEAFPEAARSALEASRRATMGEGLTDRLSSFLETATGARSLSPREGSDPDAVLSRAEAAVGSGDLPAAMTEIGTLPPEGQEAMAQWVALAQSRLDALAALEALSASISG